MVTTSDLRTRVTIETPVHTSDGSGGVMVVWNTLAHVWAAVAPMNAGEQPIGDGLRHVQQYKVIIRYRNDIKPTMRVVMGGEHFTIAAIKDMPGNQTFLTLDITGGTP